MSTWGSFADEQYCYLTTSGRVTGRPHRIEIWFALEGDAVYLLSGGRDRSDWVKNLRKTPEVTVELGSSVFSGRARVVEDAAERGRSSTTSTRRATEATSPAGGARPCRSLSTFWTRSCRRPRTRAILSSSPHPGSARRIPAEPAHCPRSPYGKGNRSTWTPHSRMGSVNAPFRTSIRLGFP